MPDVRIWAPAAKQVEVVFGDGRRSSARAEPEGWWRAPVDVGADYRIARDGGPAWPDPRSRWQPHGVEGPSRWIDPATLAPPTADVTRPISLRDAVIYEAHVGTFGPGGTFAAMATHLDELAALGVTHLELMPVAQFSGTFGWGYDGVDLFAAHEPYGGPRGLRELVGECHRRGLAVIVDVVINHFGPEGAYAPKIAPYTTTRYATPWGAAVNLDGPDARESRRFFIDSALAWLRDYGADGLRLDALHALHDHGPRHVVAELVDDVRALERARGRRFVLVGEYDAHEPLAVRERAVGGWGLDAHWNDDFHHALHVLLTGEHHAYYADFAAPGTLAKVLERGYALDGGYSSFRRAHHGRPYGELPRDRLVAYTQSHDQIGNRGGGERLVHLCGVERAKIAAALLLTSPFVPMLFQGEEWAASTPFHYFADVHGKELRAAIGEGRRREHGLERGFVDPLDAATRDASSLRWDERAREPHVGMLAWYRSLLTLRRDQPSLRAADADATRVREDAGVLIVERGDLALACNCGDEPRRVALGDVLLASNHLSTTRELPPRSCAIVRRR
jgi:maltooligosyltrehalose trehalohydrolase